MRFAPCPTSPFARLVPFGRAVVAACLALTFTPVWACSPCRAQVAAGIFDGGFLTRAAVVLLPVALVVGLGLAVWGGWRKDRS